MRVRELIGLSSLLALMIAFVPACTATAGDPEALGEAEQEMQNIFWEIDGIKGESTSEQREGAIELLSFELDHGVAMPLTSGPSASARAFGHDAQQEFTITKYVDIASPTLNLLYSSGDDIKKVEVTAFKLDKSGEVLVDHAIAFDSCIVTNLSAGGGSGDRPIETVTFSYKKITWDYAQQRQP